MSERIIVICQYYDPIEVSHQKELLESIQNNLDNPYIHRVITLNEKDYGLSSRFTTEKFAEEVISNRLTFELAFQYCNKNYPNCICILANTDIYFDDTIALVHNMKADEVYSLSKYELKEDSWEIHKNARYSFDSWIFRTPFRIPPKCNFPLGLLGCDNVIAYLLGIEHRISNPSLTIRTYHNDSRKFQKKNHIGKGSVQGPHRKLYPSSLENTDKKNIN